MKRLHIHASAVSLAVLLTGYTAAAQQGTAAASFGAQGQAAAPAPTPAPPPPPPPTGVTAEPAPAPAAQQNQAGMALPAATNANATTSNSEHDDMVGHLAVGYLGRATIPYGPFNGGAPLQAPVPVIGVRYWFDPLIGLDAGLGLWIGGTSSDNTPPAPAATTSTSGPKPTAFVIHAGLPLALASSKHMAFEIIPEANFGYASVTGDANPTKMAGTHFDLGARAGGEIHFGFIGIPQLSLIGSVGLRFQYDKLTTENTAAAGGVTKDSTGMWDLSTTVNDSPWNIFFTNVGALYYL